MSALKQNAIDDIVQKMFDLNFNHYSNQFHHHPSGHLGGIIRIYSKNKDKEIMSAHIEDNSLKGISTKNESLKKLKKIIGLNSINVKQTKKFNELIFYLNNHEFFTDVFGLFDIIDHSLIYKYEKSVSIFNMPFYAESQYLRSKIGQIEFTFRFQNLFKISRDGRIIPVPTISLTDSGHLNRFMVSLNVHTDNFHLIKKDNLVFEDLFEDNYELDLEYAVTHFIDNFVDHIIKNWMDRNDPVRQDLILLPKEALSDKINILNMYLC